MSSSHDFQLRRGASDRAWLVVGLVVLAAGVLRHVELPGLYMDAVNPEYLVVHSLRPALHNPVWTIPSKVFPILGNLYHGVQNYYLGLPFFALFGTSLTAVRVFHGLFGAVLVVLVHRLLSRTPLPAWACGLTTTALAADAAFVASLRTQYVIILGGTAWALLSVELLLQHRAESTPGPARRSRLVLSGVCFGLAVYGYFVLGFLGPALVALIVAHRGDLPARNALMRWGSGVLLGLVPYAAGYGSWWIELGSFRAFLQSLSSGVRSLQPFRPEGVIERIHGVLHLAHLAWSNLGAELLILGGQAEAFPLANAKLVILGLLVGLGLLAMLTYQRSCLRAVLFAPALLASYLAVALVFVPRLWAHHMGAVLPLVYLTVGTSAVGLALPVAQAGIWPGRIAHALLGSALVAVVSLNTAHQQRFFSRLSAVGGVGSYSDASSRLASRAVRDPESAVYVFPEWGFFMPFAFLTGNRVPYELSCEAPRVRRALTGGHDVVVASWNDALLGSYAATLERFGAKRFEREILSRRDGAPAIYLLTASAR